MIFAKKVTIIDLPKFDLIHSIKKSIEKSFARLLPKEHIGILEGMIIGDTSYISEEVKNNFRDSGISHLLAVSGANVAYILILCKFAFEKIFGRNISNGLTIIFIILFAILSGMSASVVRAAIMTIVIVLSEFLIQKPNTYTSISFSALLILLYNPIIIYDIGFLLSFSGTLGIIIFNKRIHAFLESKIKVNKEKVFGKIVAVFIETLSVTFSAQIVVTPITLYFFNTFSCISILANLIIVPATGSVTIVGIIMYVVSLVYMPLAKVISYFIYSIISFVIFSASLFAHTPGSSILLPTPSIFVIILYYVIIYNLLFIKNRKVYILSFLIVIALIILNIIPRKYINVNMIDVGQGDAIYIETPNRKNILIDSGGTEGSDYDIGENVLVPYILDKGRNSVDYAFLSHMHEDHIEGICTVIQKLKLKNLIIGKQEGDSELYSEVIDAANEHKVNVIIVEQGDKIEIDGITFDVVFAEKKNENVNNMSLILKLVYGDVSMLFTGDAEKELEEKINVKTNILKVAHHGSKTSSTEEFLRKNMPQVALISVGENNSYGHPNKEVLERLRKMNTQIYRTDLNGEIYMKLYKNGKIQIDTKIK